LRSQKIPKIKVSEDYRISQEKVETHKTNKLTFDYISITDQKEHNEVQDDATPGYEYKDNILQEIPGKMGLM
jgi:hypothetical protein